MFRRLLVAFDNSPDAQLALAEAIELARAINAELTVLTAAPQPSTVVLGYTAPVPIDEARKETERSYQALLDAAIETVPHDLPVTKLLRRGPAGPAIVDEVRASDDRALVGLALHQPGAGDQLAQRLVLLATRLASFEVRAQPRRRLIRRGAAELQLHVYVEAVEALVAEHLRLGRPEEPR